MTLFTVKDEHPAAVKSAVHEIFPQWLSAFEQLLSLDIVAELGETQWEGLAIRTAIYHVSGCSKYLATILMTFRT